MTIAQRLVPKEKVSPRTINGYAVVRFSATTKEVTELYDDHQKALDRADILKQVYFEYDYFVGRLQFMSDDSRYVV